MKATIEKKSNKTFSPKLQAILDEPFSKNPLVRKMQKAQKEAILSGEITRIKSWDEVEKEMELEQER